MSHANSRQGSKQPDENGLDRIGKLEPGLPGQKRVQSSLGEVRVEEHQCRHEDHEANIEGQRPAPAYYVPKDQCTDQMDSPDEQEEQHNISDAKGPPSARAQPDQGKDQTADQKLDNGFHRIFLSSMLGVKAPGKVW